MSIPKISVVMTTFNAERFIQEAVESILNQTFSDFEFIIVDNQSRDNTVDIIRSFHDPRICLIQNEQNLGQTKALNIGLRQARSELIARMDADDVAYPQRLKEQYEFLQKNPHIAVVSGWRLDIDEDGKPLILFKNEADPIMLRCHLATSGDLTSWCMVHSAAMMRKKALEAVGFYHEQSGDSSGYPQDYDLWSRLLVKDFQFANIPRLLIKYRIRSSSESRGWHEIMLQHRLAITKSKINFYLPLISDNDLISLAYMLEFCPQRDFKEGARVLELFNEYFEKFMGSAYGFPAVLKMRDRIQFYYLVKLVKTNKFESLKKFFQLIWAHPGFIFDLRFYYKLIKSSRCWELSGLGYPVFLRKNPLVNFRK